MNKGLTEEKCRGSRELMTKEPHPMEVKCHLLGSSTAQGVRWQNL